MGLNVLLLSIICLFFFFSVLWVFECENTWDRSEFNLQHWIKYCNSLRFRGCLLTHQTLTNTLYAYSKRRNKADAVSSSWKSYSKKEAIEQVVVINCAGLHEGQGRGYGRPRPTYEVSDQRWGHRPGQFFCFCFFFQRAGVWISWKVKWWLLKDVHLLGVNIGVFTIKMVNRTQIANQHTLK